MFLPAPAVLMTPRQCHLVERLLHDAARSVTAAGGNVKPEFEALLVDVRQAAEWHRRQITDASDVNLSSAPQSPPSSRILDTREVGWLLKISPHGVADLARRERLVGRKTGAGWEFEETDVMEYLQERAG